MSLIILQWMAGDDQNREQQSLLRKSGNMKEVLVLTLRMVFVTLKKITIYTDTVRIIQARQS